MSRSVALAGFVIGLAALVLQFVLTVPARMGTGDSLIGALIFFFTFFTILTNLMLVMIYLSQLVAWRWLGWWRLPVTRGMMAGLIVLVMGFYHVMLSGLWQPEGLFKVADITLHYVTPVLYVLWWFAFEPRGGLRFDQIGWMTVPPLLWVVWAMLRGAVINEYPYPILEAHKLGYGQVAINVLAVVVIVLLLFAVVVAVNRLPARRG